MGRYSECPDFNRKGRGVYPDNQGCISETWKKGECFIDHLVDPNVNLGGYCEYQYQNWKVNHDVSRKFKMKSRSYYGIAIKDRNGISRVAVILFESVNPEGLDRDKISKFLTGRQCKEISHLIHILERIEPSLDHAKEGGY